MIPSQSLVSIGIPTYNRADILKRSIESALNQDYKNIEVIVSDNASKDSTIEVCRNYSRKDNRFRYISNSVNRGPTQNFSSLLSFAQGDYFMWLADDDWIDENYVSRCVSILDADKAVSLVYGIPKYYMAGVNTYDGKVYNLLSNFSWIRVLSYYWKVTDNGMFYGVMRSEQIKKLKMINTMGNDWLFTASVAFLGKVRVIDDISIHRELGGATASARKIASTLGLSGIQGAFPMLMVSFMAGLDVIKRDSIYKDKSIFEKLFFSLLIFLVVRLKKIKSAYYRSENALRSIKNYFMK